MGWLDRKHRRKVRKKFHVRVFYFCDAGNHPIPVGGLIVIDPRKGYFHWPPGTPDGFKCLSSREPKWCSCYPCDQERRNAIRHSKDHKLRKFLKVKNRVMEMIEAKPKRGYWTKEKCCRKLENECERRLVLRAIRVLRKEHRLKKRDDGYLPVK